MKKPDVKALVVSGVDKALTIQRHVVVRHVDRVRRHRPNASRAEIVRALEKQYLSTVTALGAGSGAVAAAPGVGTAAATALSVAEVSTYFEATALFALAVAEVHGVRVEDLERRRTLVLAVLIGDAGSKLVEKMAGRTGPHWARKLVTGISMEQIRSINNVLGRNFVTKQGTKQGILVLGRDIPFGVGAVIGGTGNFALGYSSVRAARRAFGAAAQTPGPPPLGEETLMTSWTDDELMRIGAAEELDIAARAEDGELSRFTTIWAVRAGDAVYVRAAYGPQSAWYRRVLAAGVGRIRAGGVETDVAFSVVPESDTATHEAVDAAYHDKYDRFGAKIVATVVGPDVRSVTVRVASRST